MDIISTIQAEVYDDENVRTGWLKEEDTLSYKNALRSYMTIDASATNQPISLIASTIEYLAIYSSAEIKIRINDIANPTMTVNGQFVLSGSEITSLYVTNEDSTNTVSLDIVQGDESA